MRVTIDEQGRGLQIRPGVDVGAYGLGLAPGDRVWVPRAQAWGRVVSIGTRIESGTPGTGQSNRVRGEVEIES